MSELLYPDGHLGEYQAGLTLEDMADDRFLYPPYDWRRYKDSGRVKMIKAETEIVVPAHDAARFFREALNGEASR